MIKLLTTAAIASLTLLSGSALAQTQPVLQPMKPTNYGIFGPQGYGVETDEPSDATWINLLEPEASGILQCVRLTNTTEMRCYGPQDYYLTIDEQPDTINTVDYRIGIEDEVGAQLRTRPSQNNPEAIMEIGVTLP
jgi:hypothetical protein